MRTNILLAPVISSFTDPHRTAPHRTAPHRTAPHRTDHRDGSLAISESMGTAKVGLSARTVCSPCGLIAVWGIPVVRH
jgi:hypothetical protein